MRFLKKKIETARNGLDESEILGLKKYKEIETLLRKFPYNGKFIEEVKKIKKECSDVFNGFIEMNEKDWDLLTIICLFDRQTFEHSVGAFIILKEKIENPLKNGIILKKGIEDEVGDINIFYRACLFHDIGKITIPKFILRNSLTDKDWALSFYKSIRKQKNKISFSTKRYLKKHSIFHFVDKIAYAESPNDILKILKSKRLRPVQVIPLKYGISKKELKRLKKDYDLEGDFTLFELMNMHEKESYNILNNLAYKKEALIAGSHGRGGKSNLGNISNAHSSIRIGSRMSDIVDLIYMADVQDALGNDRYYHKSFTKLKILSFLVMDIKNELLDAPISFLWIEDEFEKLKKEKDFQEMLKKIKTNKDEFNEKELDIIKDLKIVNDFLSSLCVVAK